MKYIKIDLAQQIKEDEIKIDLEDELALIISCISILICCFSQITKYKSRING
jgi:hypothetical protein